MTDTLEYTKHFSRHELVCRCGCNRVAMDPEFMRRLERVREIYGKPMTPTSGYRCIDHDEAVAKAHGRDRGAAVHTTGKAIDIAIAGSDARLLIEIACLVGFTGIGVSQRDEYGNRFIHIDDIEPGGRHPRPHLWSY